MSLSVLNSGGGGGSRVTLDGERVKELAMTSYNGDNPYTMGQEGMTLAANTLLKDGLQIINGVSGAGKYLWRRLNDNGELVDYVVSNNHTSYPIINGEQDGYYYEVLIDSLEPGAYNGKYFTPWDDLQIIMDMDRIADANSLDMTGDLVIPDGIQGINNQAFEFCSDLMSVIIPDSVVMLGEQAFSSCSNLQFVNLGDGITYIPMEVFSGCSRLETIVIGAGVTSIDLGAFEGCEYLKHIKFRGSRTQWDNIQIEDYNDAIENCDVTFNYHSYYAD